MYRLSILYKMAMIHVVRFEEKIKEMKNEQNTACIDVSDTNGDSCIR